MYEHMNNVGVLVMTAFSIYMLIAWRVPLKPAWIRMKSKININLNYFYICKILPDMLCIILPFIGYVLTMDNPIQH